MDCLGAALDAETTEQAPQMHLDGVFANAQMLRNLPIAKPLIKRSQQLHLALGKTVSRKIILIQRTIWQQQGAQRQK